MTALLLHEQLNKALGASEKMLLALSNGDFNKAIELDDVRMEFIRELAKHRNKSEILVNYDKDIQNLYLLDKKILKAGEKLRDEVLTDMGELQSSHAGRLAYVENQRLSID